MNHIPAADRKILGEQGIATPAELTARVLKDDKFLIRFSTEGVREIKTIVSGVVSQRARSFVDKSRPVTDGGVLKYRFDFLVAIAVLLILVALGRDYFVLPPPQVVVGRSGGLEPFHTIASGDLRLSCESSETPSPSVLGNVVGHYSAEYLKPCSPIDPKKLSFNAAQSVELNGRILLSLKAQPSALFAGVPPPFKANLIVVPRERGTTSLLMKDLLVLNLQKDTDGLSLVVAIPATDEPTLAPYLARSDFVLAVERH